MEAKTRIDRSLDGSQRWLVLRWEGTPKGDLEVKERLPLHVDKMPKEKADWFMDQIGMRLHKKIARMAGMKVV